ncbi:hypothetical protein Hanom_Chr05g00457461 [Helianthus anomalus]
MDFLKHHHHRHHSSATSHRSISDTASQLDEFHSPLAPTNLSAPTTSSPPLPPLPPPLSPSTSSDLRSYLPFSAPSMSRCWPNLCPLPLRTTGRRRKHLLPAPVAVMPEFAVAMEELRGRECRLLGGSEVN